MHRCSLLSSRYTAVAQTICLNVFEAFTAEALAAMGQPAVRDRLYKRLDSMGITAHRSCSGGVSGDDDGKGVSGDDDGEAGDGGGELPSWLEARISKHGVPFHKYVLLREADDPEDDLCEFEKQTLANIAANRKKLQELGLL